MRILGNSLTTPQAIQCLGQAVQILRPEQPFSMDAAIDACMTARLRSDNFLVYPCELGWVAVTPELYQEVLPRLSTKSPWGQLRLQDSPVLHSIWISDEVDTIQIQVVFPPGISVDRLVEFWDLQVPLNNASEIMPLILPPMHDGAVPPTQPVDARLEVLQLPPLPSLVCLIGRRACHDLEQVGRISS